MLYLVRKIDESIMVNDDIEIKIVEIKRNSVKLGISFPTSATVLRKEIYMRIASEKALEGTADSIELSNHTDMI